MVVAPASSARRCVLPAGRNGAALVTVTSTSKVRAGSVRAALAEVLGTPGRVAGFLVAAGVVACAYSLLLPFASTQRLAWSNWDYLTAPLVAWSVALGVAMGLVVSVQVRAVRRVVAARAAAGAVGGLAFVASLLPSFLCCTPIVPSVLAFIGVSGVGLYTTTGTVQHFFAVHQTEFLASSLTLLVAMAWWGLRTVARASCLAEDGCAVGPMAAGDQQAHDRGASAAGCRLPAGEEPAADRAGQHRGGVW